MTPEQAAALREPFPAEQVGKNQDNLDFVGHAAVTARLLKVHPEWTWEPMAFNEHGDPHMSFRSMGIKKTKKGDEYELFFASMWIRLTVAGVTRPGVGGADVYPWTTDIEKLLISDAIKNAAMRFGVALDLWAKEDLHAEPKAAQADLDDISGVLAGIADEHRGAAIDAWKDEFGKPSELLASQVDEALKRARALAGVDAVEAALDDVDVYPNPDEGGH